jgi:hypothetical protein
VFLKFNLSIEVRLTWSTPSNCAYYAPDWGYYILCWELKNSPFKILSLPSKRKELIMKKTLMMLFLTLYLSATAGSVLSEEMAKEGSGTGTTYFTATSQIHAQGKENVVINYEARGVAVTDNKTSPFYMSSGICVGSVKGMKGFLKESGLCTYTRPDGDQIYMSYTAEGIMGSPMRGTFAIVGGTGKCTGLTGTGNFERTSLKSPAKGISASFSESNISWKMY